MPLKHLDLFSGIGGFALAVEEVWPDAEHIFCDNDPYCQQLLKLRWPNSKIYGDIRTITDTTSDGCWQSEATKDEKGYAEKSGQNRELEGRLERPHCFLLTGGFPCQPFSQAGKRRGTEDNRYLWPEMLRVIRLTKPQWVIAENVRGILTLQGGVVFEQVCLDLESAGYQVQPFVIPAVAVNAPHRRDRVWFVAKNTINNGNSNRKSEKQKYIGNKWNIGSGNEIGLHNDQNTSNPRPQYGKQGNEQGMETDQAERAARSTDPERQDKNASDTSDSMQSGQYERQGQGQFRRSDWQQNWLEVATQLCGVDAKLSERVDRLELSAPRHRVERLKALGNAVVPAVVVQILKAIKYSNENM